jgi:hypothetical protein
MKKKTKVSELNESKNIMYTCIIEHSIIFISMVYVPRPFSREDMGGDRFTVYFKSVVYVGSCLFTQVSQKQKEELKDETGNRI